MPAGERAASCTANHPGPRRGPMKSRGAAIEMRSNGALGRLRVLVGVLAVAASASRNGPPKAGRVGGERIMGIP